MARNLRGGKVNAMTKLMLGWDWWMRLRAQSFFNWLGRRWGVTRESYTYHVGWALPFISAASVAGDESPLLVKLLTGTTLFLINGWWAFCINMRGIKLLQDNEEWGQHSNWYEWRWLRLTELFLLPLVLTLNLGRVLGGELLEIFNLLRSGVLLSLLYCITISEPPPRTASQTVRARAHAGSS